MKEQLDMLIFVQVCKAIELNYDSQCQVFGSDISWLWTQWKIFDTKEKHWWLQTRSEEMSTQKSKALSRKDTLSWSLWWNQTIMKWATEDDVSSMRYSDLICLFWLKYHYQTLNNTICLLLTTCRNK